MEGKMKSSWIRRPISNYCEKRRGHQRPRYTPGGRPCEGGGRDCNNVATSQRTQGFGATTGSRERGMEQTFHTEPPEGTNPADTLISDFWPPCLMALKQRHTVQVYPKALRISRRTKLALATSCIRILAMKTIRFYCVNSEGS